MVVGVDTAIVAGLLVTLADAAAAATAAAAAAAAPVVVIAVPVAVVVADSTVVATEDCCDGIFCSCCGITFTTFTLGTTEPAVATVVDVSIATVDVVMTEVCGCCRCSCPVALEPITDCRCGTVFITFTWRPVCWSCCVIGLATTLVVTPLAATT